MPTTKIPSATADLAPLIRAAELADGDTADRTGEYGNEFDTLYDRFIAQEGLVPGHAAWLAACAANRERFDRLNRKGMVRTALAHGTRETRHASALLTAGTDLPADVAARVAELVAAAQTALTAAAALLDTNR